MKLYEFLNNESDFLVQKMEELIYFDEKWMFPEYNVMEHLQSDLFKISSDFIDIANKVVNEFNNRNIDPLTYDKSIFIKILKELN